MGREQVLGCERYEDRTILLRALICNAVGEEGLSNDIKAAEYRTRLYAIYTTLGTSARTMFVHVSQDLRGNSSEGVGRQNNRLSEMKWVVRTSESA